MMMVMMMMMMSIQLCINQATLCSIYINIIILLLLIIIIIIMRVIHNIVIFGSTLCLIINQISSRSVQSARSGRICPPDSSYCEDPPHYPGPTIRELLRNQTFPQGTFDRLKKRNTEKSSINYHLLHSQV